MPRLRPELALLILAGLIASIPAVHAGGQAAPAYYDLAFSLEHEGEQLGEPRLLVEPGRLARIRVEPGNRTSGYRLEVVARPGGPKDDEDAIDVATRLYLKSDGRWVLDSEPRLVVKPGKPASLSVGDRADPDRSLHVTLVAQPIDRDAAEQMRKAWEASSNER